MPHCRSIRQVSYHPTLFQAILCQQEFSWNISEELLREAYHVVELAFWAWAPAKGQVKEGIQRNRTAPDTPQGISHFPHVILNQSRVNALMIDDARRHGGPEVEYGYDVKRLEVDSATAHNRDECRKAFRDPYHDAYPVTVYADKGGEEQVFRAKYVLVSIPEF